MGVGTEVGVPTARAMPIHALLGLTMRYHMKFQE